VDIIDEQMLCGTVTDRNPVQTENAELPMLVTLLGITTFVSPLQ
jgi:hypothetical protein